MRENWRYANDGQLERHCWHGSKMTTQPTLELNSQVEDLYRNSSENPAELWSQIL
jgi:hypothetical protein